MTGDTVIETKPLDVRDRAEVERDLSVVGFEVESISGDADGTPVDGVAQLMIFVARAR
ncbi:SAM-dependent methyltransferase [Microbacterium testaceum StLB037]|uniref:SAM-dependent methyltransferase n=1 Tax=Microbacterium testaceum (strain StLB037) TaxID=979556 RepID=E8N8Q1_MICTS|nr:hypothetical protein [Microbacterium testaceum]BAJ75707.1 SAM-dependent methyltransferase [Microbacterium testaceum StLB037]